MLDKYRNEQLQSINFEDSFQNLSADELNHTNGGGILDGLSNIAKYIFDL